MIKTLLSSCSLSQSCPKNLKSYRYYELILMVVITVYADLSNLVEYYHLGQ